MPLQQLFKGKRFTDVITLSVVYSQFAQLIHNGTIFNKLGYGIDLQQIGHPLNTTHHLQIHFAGFDITDKLAIDFQDVDWQLLEIAKRADPRAKIIQCQLAAQFV